MGVGQDGEANSEVVGEAGREGAPAWRVDWFGFAVSHRGTEVSLTAAERPHGEQLGEKVDSVLNIISEAH